jgi:hypothetical protein
MTATVDKEAADRRATEEDVAERAAAKATTNEEAMVRRAMEDAVVKAAADGDSSAPSQAPSVAETKRTVAPSGSTSPAKRPYRGVWKPRFVQLVPFFSRGFTL